jgi:hypothetical protein
LIFSVSSSLFSFYFLGCCIKQEKRESTTDIGANKQRTSVQLKEEEEEEEEEEKEEGEKK